jgi:outer membrane protein assembly factor BamB
MRPAASAPRIPEESLREHGLETLWFSPGDPSDNPVQMVELLPEGLFVATIPSDEREGRLKMFSRTSGEAAWYAKLDYPLQAPPTAYRYPRLVEGKSDEVYFTQADTVVCADLKYGDVLWSKELPFTVSSSVVADELNYFVGSDTGRVYGLKKNTGIEEWTYRTGGAIRGNPVAQGTNVYFTSLDGVVYRFLSATPGWVTGTSWQHSTGARIVSDPVVFSRWVLVGSTDYKLYCLEGQDGTEVWAFQAEAPVETTPVVYSHRSNQEYVYCIAVQRTGRQVNRTLFAVSLRDGREAWRRESVRKVVAMGKQSLYVLSDPDSGAGRNLVALDVTTGEERFRLPLGRFDFVPLNSADSGRFLAERGKVYLVAADGTIQVLTERM